MFFGDGSGNALSRRWGARRPENEIQAWGQWQWPEQRVRHWEGRICWKCRQSESEKSMTTLESGMLSGVPEDAVGMGVGGGQRGPTGDGGLNFW